MSFPSDIYKWNLITGISADQKYLPIINVRKALPNLRWDGTDPSGTNLSAVQSLINTKPGKYYFPYQSTGPLMLSGGLLTIPSNREVFGDLPNWDRNNSVWNQGTVILGGFQTSASARNIFIHDIGLDNAANTVTVGGGNAMLVNQTGFWNVRLLRIHTRANDHNILIEQNGTDPQGAAIQGGGVLVEDVHGYGGPNGLAIKAYDVTVRNSKMNDTTVQAFVSVSDNINGNAVYSRSQYVRFLNCGGDNNITKLRCYSRDTRSLSNTNGVQPQYWVFWDGGDLGACGQYGAHIGDFSSQTSMGPVGTQTLLTNRHVFISNAKCDRNGNNGLLFTRADTAGYEFIHFENNGLNTGFTNKHVDFDTSGNVLNFSRGRRCSFRGASLGKEQGIVSWPVNSSSVTTDLDASLYTTANTATTTISSVTSQRPGEEIRIQIGDTFTTLSFAKDVNGSVVSKTGKGTIQKAVYDSVNSAFIDIS